jgi:hypothetical protein
VQQHTASGAGSAEKLCSAVGRQQQQRNSRACCSVPCNQAPAAARRAHKATRFQESHGETACNRLQQQQQQQEEGEYHLAPCLHAAGGAAGAGGRSRELTWTTASAGRSFCPGTPGCMCTITSSPQRSVITSSASQCPRYSTRPFSCVSHSQCESHSTAAAAAAAAV